MSGPAHQTVSVSLTAETSDFQQKFQVSQEDLETWRQSAQSAGTEARETARDLDALGDEATETGQRLDDLGDEAKDVGQQVKRAGDAFERATRPLDLLGTRARMSAVGLDVLDDAAARLPGPLATVARAIGPVGLALGAAAVAGGLAAAAIARAGDAYTAATGRLRAATGSLAAATDTYGQLYAAALDTGAALDDTVGAFVRFNIAAQAIGATRDEVAALVETVQKFGIVSGASTAEVSAGAQQLAQALASGRLQGDELRSILENMPLLAKALAENLGVSIGRLREMGAAGELTARRVFDALAEAGDEADRLFEAMPLTIERASATLETAWDRFLVKLDRGLGLSERIAAALAGAAEKLDDLSRTPTVKERIAALEAEIGFFEANDPDGYRSRHIAGYAAGAAMRVGDGALQEELKNLRLIQQDLDRFASVSNQMAAANAAARAAQERRTAALIAFQGVQADLLTQQERARQQYAERIAAIDAAAAAGADAAEVTAARTAAERELQEALARGTAGGRQATSEAERRRQAIADTIGSLTVQVAAEAALAQATGAGAEAVRAATIARETQEALRALAIEASTEEADLIGRLIARLHEERQAREDRAPLGAAQDRLAALEREADALARVAGQRSLTRDQLQVIASLTERAIDLTSDQAREELRLAEAIADRTRAVEMARAASTSWRDGAVAAIHDVAVAAADNAAIAEAAFSGVFSSWQDSFTEFFRDFSRGIADVGDLVAALGDAVLDQVARIAAQSVTASLARTAGAGLGLAGAGAADGGVLEWLGLGADAAGLVGGGGSVGTTAARWLGLTTPALPGVPPGPAGIGGVTPAGALSPFGSHLAAGIDAAPWGIAGSLAASLLGFQGTGNQWADLGLSTLGSVGGGAAGAALLAPALGAAGGPVGAAAGAFLAMVGGDLLSGLFGQPLPNASQSIDIAGGRVVAQAPEGRLLSQEEIAEWGAASQAALVGPIQSLVDTLARAGADASGYAVATSWKDGRQSVGLYGGDFTRGGSGTWTDVESLAEAGVVAVRELALAVAGGDASLADAALVARDSTADTADALARQIALAADWEGTLARTEAQYITAHRQMAEMAAGLAQWEQGARAVLAPMVETRDILAAAGRDTGDLSVGLEHLAETMLGLHDTALSPVQVAVQTATGQIDALGRMLEDLGYSADRTAGYLAALEEAVIGQMRDQFDEANQDRVYELTGMGAIPDLRAIANSYVHAMTDAAALGADTALLTRRALLEVQATVEGMDVAGLSGLIAEIEGMGHEGQAVELVLDGLNAALDGMGDAADGAAGQVSGAADRIAAANRGLERRLLAASVDTGSLEGALALFDWDAAVEMAELSALGADITLLERALAEERLDIIQRFTDDAVAAERRRAEEMARAWDQAASVIAGIATDIRQYLDGVYGGASSPLGTHARMDRAVDDFWAAYARAQTGDRAALSAITRYDATARDAIAAYHASSAPADALYAQMTAALGADTALLTRRALLEVQATVEGMDAAGLSDLIAEIEGMGHEGQAVELVLDGLNAALDGLGDAAGDTAGQVSGAADRIAAAAEQRRADQARQAWEQEAAWIAGQQRSIAQWVSGLFAGASSPLGPDARLAVASEDYLAQLALAESGDRAALQSITQYAQQYVEAGAAAHASGPLAAQIALAVRDDLLALSEALTPEEYIAAEITAAIETQTVDITDATDAAAQLLDSTFRALDANDDGGISWAEFQTWAAQDAGRIDALRSTMGSGFSGYSIRDLYNAIDANGDGTVSQLEWLRAVTGQVEDHTAASAITADLLYDYLRQMHNGLVTSYFVGVADISAAVERVRGAILALPHAAGGPAAGLTLVNEHLVPEIIRLPGGAEVVTAESSAAMIRRMVDAPGLGSVGETLVLPPVAPADGALTDALAGLRAEVRGLSRRLDRLVAGQQAQTDLLDDTAHDQTGHLRRAADGIARQTERLAALEVLRP